MTGCYHGNWIFVCLSALLMSEVESGDFTLGMDKQSSCTNAHYYQAGDIFLASARDAVHNGNCPLTFIQSGADGSGYTEPCLSLCVKIIGYSMESCLVKMAYHDGLNDFSPVTFDCRTFPPVLWCSSKNDLKVTVSEMKNYHLEEGKGYKISLEIKPFCGTLEQLTTDSSIVAQPQAKPSSMSQTAVIIGAIVGTISILFVLGWIMYCYKKRHGSSTASHSSSSSRPDRNVRGSTPNQPTNRYAPIERNPPSSKSSSDKGPQYRPNVDRNQPDIISNLDRRLYSPFQPPQTNRGQYQGQYPSQGQGQIQQQVLYSDIDRGPQPGDKWYPMTKLGPTGSELNPTPGFTSSSTPSNPMSQYMMQNQVYKYPADGEMHTVPTDTRYVVYDFDFEAKPVERKYSEGKILNTAYRQSPVKDIDRSRPREITPLRETVRVMPPIVAAPVESTTTDHTSDNDSSISETTEDDTTDDQTHPGRYNFVPGYSYNNPPAVRPNISNTRLYDPRNFQRIDNPGSSTGNQSDKFRPSAQNSLSESFDGRNNSEMFRSSPNANVYAQPSTDEQTYRKEGPVPQVPPMPKEFQRAERSSPSKELLWPHGPPPPYSEENKFVV
ncbi:uncharacterized protein LOC123528660 [Mercenaria mercenaria]|uniref:uncharacterized protein LOC123528660 n=1 Tax=Mercenaria mercenaria TaxID=6596 RepID=UPI00234E915D|nr:uncharacterized protein LOC123528660 [Mercenaria mercenaria]XP_045164488.2 uncharacterized protein LOC123528660 [Mercenaria mercenaria]XP_045164489.2 uncharacterized protein LOC123528660 [Mercenaria mercenaria]